MLRNERGRLPELQLFGFALLCLIFGAHNAQAGQVNDVTLDDAIRHNDLALVNKLLSQGADVNAQDSFARTALHHAVIRGNAAIVKTLLAHGARVNQRSHMCETPLSLAEESRDTKIAALLREAGASKDKAEPSYWEVEAEGVALKNDRKGALTDALDQAAGHGFAMLFDTSGPKDDWDKVFKKLRKHRNEIIRSHVVLSETTEEDLRRAKIKATLDLCRIYELIGCMGNNLDKE
jgi:ankyrin repeat protein